MSSMNCLLENHHMDDDFVMRIEAELKGYIFPETHPNKLEVGYELKFCDDFLVTGDSDPQIRYGVILFKKSTPYASIQKLAAVYKERVEIIASGQQLNPRQTQMVTKIEVVKCA